MISLRRPELGCIAIDYTEEPRFHDSDEKVELTSSLFMKPGGSPGLVFVDDVGQPGPTSAHIVKVLKAKGYTVELDNNLIRLLKAFRAEQELVESVRTGKATEISFSPTAAGITRELLEHQKIGVKYALTVQNAANFSVPGSGKTTIALCVYGALKQAGVVDQLLVIGPASCFDPWEEEFENTSGRRCNSIRVIGTRVERTELLRHVDGVDLILCTYQMAYRERESISRALSRGKYLLVLDESHHIKNINLGPWAETALQLAPLAERRMILTGTPAPHSPRDLWTQFTFLWPSQVLVGTRLQFEQRLQGEPQQVPDALRQYLKPFFNRTKKSDLGLPEPQSIFVKIPAKELPKRQKLILKLLELRTIQEARTLGLSGADISVLRRWRRARTIRLLQAASNPALLTTALEDVGEYGGPLDDEPVLASALQNYLRHEIPAKVSFTIEKVREIVGAGKKVVVWATFVQNLRLLERLLQDLRPLLIFGEVPAYAEDSDPGFESRESRIMDFKHSEDRYVLLANPAACAESISLHMVCHDAIYLERNFNCGQFLQSMDRIHRVGMPKNLPPKYHIPLIECAIETVLDRRLRDRQRVLYRLLDDDMPVLGLEDDFFGTNEEESLDDIFAEVIREIRGVRKSPATSSLKSSRTPR